MGSSKQIASRFREVLLDGKWIANTNYTHSLSDLSWQEATHKIGSLNTIAALAYHINYYMAGVLNVFEGGALEIKDKYSFDLPEIKSQEDWDKLRKDLASNAEAFAKHIELMAEEKLETTFVHEKLGNYRRNIEAMTEHAYYHLGQIVLIKKMVREASADQ